jgi:hypothetical protein
MILSRLQSGSGPNIKPPLGVAAALLGASCSILIDAGRTQCSTDADCHHRGSAFAGSFCIDSVCRPDPTWSCLGSVVRPPLDPHRVSATLTLVDLITEEPLTNVDARLCRKLDITCEQPIQMGLRPDASGRLVVQADAGFDGYVELSSPGNTPGLYFFFPPLDSDRVVPFVPLMSPDVLAGLALIGGRDLAADRGHVLLRAYDCLHRTAGGVTLGTVDADEQTSPFYVIEKIPSATATATDGSGEGGLLNLRPGGVTLTGELADGTRIGTVSVFVRAGQITYTTVLPAPD